jgi:pilus assembly protein CpaC
MVGGVPALQAQAPATMPPGFGGAGMVGGVPVLQAQAPAPQPPPAPLPPAVGAGENARPGQAAPAELAPMPAAIPPFGPGQIRLPRLPGQPGPLGTTPIPSPQVQAEYNRFIQEFIDPRNTLDLIADRVRVILLKEAPKRVQIGDEAIATYNLMGPKEVSIVGHQVGTTVLNLWFTDPADPAKEKILSYLIRVLPDPEAKERLERVYKALQDEINCAFPDSLICLTLVGDKVVLSGQAKDIADATQILRIVRANAPPEQHAARIPVNSVNLVTTPGDLAALGGTPGLENYFISGSSNVINLLRITGEQQVMLKVTVAEVNRAAARSIGVNFSISNDQGTTVFAQNTGNIANSGSGATGFGRGTGSNLANGAFGSLTNNLPVSLDNGEITLAINALRNLDYARSLAEPTLVALNGQSAAFQAGGQFPVPIVTGFTASGLQGVSFVPYGVQLSFTPYITDRDRIRLNVAANVSTRDFSAETSINGSNVPGLNTRNFQTTVELREGQTLAVAGLLQTSLGADATRVPLFGDLPVVGRLFAFDRTSAGEQELVILVTPQLVHPMQHDEVPPLPGSDLYEPGDLEFYLLGRLESRRAYDYRSPARTDIDRMCAYRHCEETYIQGPHGYSDAPPAQPLVPGSGSLPQGPRGYGDAPPAQGLIPGSGGLFQAPHGSSDAPASLPMPPSP